MDMTLPRDSAYSPMVGLMIAQLDDQLRRLREFLEGWKVTHLEWQAKPGRNTAGMLLAHMAIVELIWMHLASGGSRETREARVRATLGIGLEADGIPIEKDGRHTPALAGRTVEQYVAWLEKARASTRQAAAAWSDADLDVTFDAHGHRFSRAWVLYHLLEHFAAHFGQLALLGHMMRDNKGSVPARET
jgi:uncharacterized damage-inducible protein DinB